MKKLLLILLVSSLNAEIIDGNTNAIASPRDLSLNTIEAGGSADPTQTTSIKNYTLTNLSGQDRLWTFASTSLLVLENATLELDGTYTFTHGSIRIVGNCAINGSSDFNKFRFESHLIHITEGAELRIGPGVNFEYAPTCSASRGIRFGSSSSKLTLEDATLTISNKYGLNLIGGQLRIEGSSTVDNFFKEDNVQYLDHLATYTEKALVLGYGPTSYGDCKLNITSGSKLTVKNAGIIYRNVGNAFDAAHGDGSLVIDKKGSFLVIDDANFNSSGIKLDFSKLKSMVEEGITTSISQLAQISFRNSTSRNLGANLSQDGKYIAVAGLNSMQIEVLSFNGTSFTSIDEVALHADGGNGYSCDWTPDGNYLAASGSTSTANNEINICSFNGTNLVSLGNWGYYAAGGSVARSCKWTPDGRHLAAVGNAGSNQQVLLYRFDGTSLVTLGNWKYGGTGDNALKCSWSPDGKYLSVVGVTGDLNQVSLFHFENSTLTPIGAYNYYQNADIPSACNWSYDGKFLIVGGSTSVNNQIEIYKFDTSSTTTLSSLGNWDFYESGDGVSECDFSPDGKYLLISGSTGTVWQVEMYNFDGAALSVIGIYEYHAAYYYAHTCRWTQDSKYALIVGDYGSGANSNTIKMFKVDHDPDDQKITSFKDTTLKLDKDLTLRDINLKMK